MFIVKRTNIKNITISIVLAIAFFAQDIVWAYPDLHARNMSDKLAAQSFLQQNDSPAKTQAMEIHLAIAKKTNKPLQEISMDDIRDAACSLVKEYEGWALENNIKVGFSKKEVFVTFSSGYAIRYFVSPDGIRDADTHPEMTVVSTVQFKNTNFIYKQLLKIKPGESTRKLQKKVKLLSPVEEAEKLNLKINKQTATLLKYLERSSLRMSYIVSPPANTMRDDFTQTGYVNTPHMRVLSDKISVISKKWSKGSSIAESAAKIVSLLEERDTILEKLSVDDYRSVRGITGAEKARRIVLLLSGIELGLDKAVEVRDGQKHNSALIGRLREISGHIRETKKWISGNAARPEKDMAYCERALTAMSNNSPAALAELLTELAHKLSVLDFLIVNYSQETLRGAVLKNIPLFKQLYNFTDKHFGAKITSIAAAPGVEWIFLLPAIALPEYQTTVIGIMMFLFTAMHLFNIDWKDFARAPPQDKFMVILKTVSAPLFLTFAAVCSSYYGDTLCQIVCTNIVLHSALNIFSVGSSKTGKQNEAARIDRAADWLELDTKRELLNEYLNNVAEVLCAIPDKIGNEKEYEGALTKLFGRIAEVYKMTSHPSLIENRKKLLATFILANIKPPSKNGASKTGNVIQSALRSEICRKILRDDIFGSKDPDMFQPALEAIIEILAKDTESGRTFFFDRYYPLLKESGKLPGFAKALIDVLIKAEHHGVKLFYIADENRFFDETKLIIKDLSSSMPSLRRDITSYLFDILHTQGEIPLVRRLLDDINFHIVSSEEFGHFSAARVAEKIRVLQRERPNRQVVLVLSGGTTMPPFLDELATMPRIDWLRVEIFHHTEYKGKSPDNPYSFAHMIKEHLVKKVYKEIDYNHFHPIGAVPSVRGYIEELNSLGGADILILGVGSNGHIGYNGVGTLYDKGESGSLKLVRLEDSTLRENVATNPDIRKDPYAYTMSMADIMSARKIYLMASGPRKTHIIKMAFEKPLVRRMPVSVILDHPNISVILDGKAVEGLTADQFSKYAKAAEKLDRAEKRMRLLINDKLKPSHKIDREGTLVWIAPEEAKILGYRPEEMVGRPIWDFVADTERDMVRKIVRAKLGSAQELPPIERKYRRADGKELWFHIEEQQVLDEEGRVAGIISHMADITKERVKRDRLLSEMRSIEEHMNGNGNGRTNGAKAISTDIASDYNRSKPPSAPIWDLANKHIIIEIGDDKAIEIDDKNERVIRISHARLNNRAPPIEEHFRNNGTFDKIRAAKDTVLLSAILSKSNFRNLTQYQKGELIKIAQRLNLSMILGKSYVAKDWENNSLYFVRSHVRTGRRYSYHRLMPTVWIGEVSLNRLSVKDLAQLLLEESQHILKKPMEISSGVWINTHGKISKSLQPEFIIEHDDEFMASIDKNDPSFAELSATAEPPAWVKTSSSKFAPDAEITPVGATAQVLLSENLFDQDDADNLRGLLKGKFGDNPPIDIKKPEDMKRLYRARKNIACVVTADDYDNPNRWDKAESMVNKTSLIVLREDLRGSRYLLLNGVIRLACAMMASDKEKTERYMKALFENVGNKNDTELLEMLLQDPREFSKYIRLNAEPVDSAELLNQYKLYVENFLIKA